MFHDGNRQLQDQFDSRRIADRLEEKLTRQAFTEQDRAFVENAMFFFLATADAEGKPDCSFKGGTPGFVRIIGPGELAFPDYDGNGMFKSLGNILANPAVGLLFIDMGEKPRRLRVNGQASVSRDDPLDAALRRPSFGAGQRRGRSSPIVRATSDARHGGPLEIRAAAGLSAAGTGLEGLRRLQGLHSPKAEYAQRRVLKIAFLSSGPAPRACTRQSPAPCPSPSPSRGTSGGRRRGRG
jgi:predicted pyridoxine 5'-phosphate oxidase superfamily flavin-nucleotide-binding protein